jgi:hypothetical protein
MQTERHKEQISEAENKDAIRWVGSSHSSVEVSVMGMEQRGRVSAGILFDQLFFLRG